MLFSGALCALCLALSTLTVEAQSTGPETAYQEGQAGGLLGVLEAKKTAIVGSWQGAISNGHKILLTYNSDGTAHNTHQGEISTNPAQGVLTPLHGVWTHLGSRQFGVTFKGIFYDINTGELKGFITARLLLTLNEAGDELSGIDAAQVFDPDGNVVATLPSGNVSFKRIQFEPFN
jgi:hypothetical protein